MHDLIQEVENQIRSRKTIAPRQKLLIAVSGGVDSMVLLRVMHELSPLFQWQLVAAHFNHQLRGQESDGDEAMVAEATSHLAIPLVTGRADVREWKKEQNISTEMAARDLRHAFLAQQARKLGSRVVVLAHHADDQVELFLMRLVRGGGAEGLAGMKDVAGSPADPQVQLVRPFLGIAKEKLLQYAQDEGIAYREDLSNQCQDYLRNRVRLDLVPHLEKDYQPAVKSVILRTMDILREENNCIASWALAWEKRKKRGAFGHLPVAVQRYLVQKRLVLNKIDPSFELIEKLRSAPETWICAFGKTRVLMDAQGEIKVSVIDTVNTFPEIESDEGWVDISADAGSVYLGITKISWKRRPWQGEARERQEHVELFDAESVGKTIRLRYWRPGDRFHPIGMKGAVKLQDLFTNNKTPPAERHLRVVAETLDGRLFWVQGLRMSEPFKMVPNTRYCLRWSWEPA